MHRLSELNSISEPEVQVVAAKLGLHIPKACGMGICGTCRMGSDSATW